MKQWIVRVQFEVKDENISAEAENDQPVLDKIGALLAQLEVRNVQIGVYDKEKERVND